MRLILIQKREQMMLRLGGSKMTKDLVFIHCFGNLTFEARPLIKYFEEKGINCHEFEYKKCFGQVSLGRLSNDFNDFTKKINDDFVLIGLSQGGIIGSYWLEFLEGKRKCEDMVSVCSPFYGSYSAYLLPLKGVKELRPGSKFLYDLREKMKKSSVKYHCIWNPLDLMVFPGSHAKLKEAYKTKKVIAPIHGLTFSRRGVKETIENVV